MTHQTFEPIDLSRATHHQLAMVNAALDAGAPEVWRDIAELNFVALRFSLLFDAQTDDELAVMAVNLVHQLVESFGGTHHYIPLGRKIQTQAKSNQIVKEFDGKNIRRLALKHNFSEVRVRQIIKKDADLKKSKKQGLVVP